jgi:hypothetical protein
MPDPDLVDPVVAVAIDGKTTEPRPVEPIKVAMISGTGDGSRLPSGTVATTEGEHQPNLVVRVVTPTVGIFVRAVHLMGKTVLGLLGGAMTPKGQDLLWTGDFWQLLTTCVVLSITVVAVGILTNVVTVFGDLENRFPLLTGKV